MGRGVTRAAFVAFTLVGVCSRGRAAWAGDDEVGYVSIEPGEALPDIAPPIVVIAQAVPEITSVPTLTTVAINVTVSTPTPAPFRVDWSLRIRPLPVAPPRPIVITREEDPVIAGLNLTPPVEDSPRRVSRRRLLAAGIATLSASYVLSTIPLFVHWRDPMLALPVLGPFAQAAVWGANAGPYDRAFAAFGIAYEIFTGFAQAAGLGMIIAGECRAARTETQGPRIALLPGAADSGAGATIVGRW